MAPGSCGLHSEGVTPSPVFLQPPRWTQVTSRSCSKRRRPTSSKSTPAVSLPGPCPVLARAARCTAGVRTACGAGEPVRCPLPSRATQHRRRGQGEPSAVVPGRAVTLAGAPSAPTSPPPSHTCVLPSPWGPTCQSLPQTSRAHSQVAGAAGSGSGGESHAPRGLERAPHALVAGVSACPEP